ncbi:hypothetical protein ACFC08_16950 [Streptomyces sp. NPDC056112]|uniref:hypothetical protein n=1 Tax=Streptomyces sp. NPDC056112 TaxID=3345715 RepID=UPI0035D6D140
MADQCVGRCLHGGAEHGGRAVEVIGERKRFWSKILPPWRRKSPRASEILPLFYLLRDCR